MPSLKDDQPVEVECYAGGRGEETPRRFRSGGCWEEITVLARWISESAEGKNRLRWFRVRLERGLEGLLYHDEALDAWFWRSRVPRSATPKSSRDKPT